MKMNLSPKVLALAAVGAVGAWFAYTKLVKKPQRSAAATSDTLRTYPVTAPAPAQQSITPQPLLPSYMPPYPTMPTTSNVQPMPSPSTVYSVGQFLQSFSTPSYAPPGTYWVNTTPTNPLATWMLQSYNNPVPMPQQPAAAPTPVNYTVGQVVVQAGGLPPAYTPPGTQWVNAGVNTWKLQAGTATTTTPTVTPLPPPFSVPATGMAVLTQPGYWQVTPQTNGLWLATRYAAIGGGALRTLNFPISASQADITTQLQANDNAYAPVNRQGAV